MTVPDKQIAIQRQWLTSSAPGRSGGPPTSRPTVLAIAGDSAAGKSTLTKGLIEALGADESTAVCVDDYHRYDREERRTKAFTPLHPDCNYVDIMEQHLQLLAVGQPILKPVYNHDDGTLGRPVLVRPRRYVIIEGLLPLHTKLARACADVTVYLDPPEPIRYDWKIKRDTEKRGFTGDQVRADLARREPESAAYIRPQRAHADIVVRFSPITERGESATDVLSATLLLRSTIRHPDLSGVLGDHNRAALHLKMVRDDNGKPVDALHIHGYARREMTRKVEEAIWAELGIPEPLPDNLGMIEPGRRSEPLALTQLILLFHMLTAQRP